MSVDLLGMLAEVASNSLQHDTSLSAPSRLHLKKSTKARNSTSQLLKLFSKFDGDEMRRKFTFTCVFDVGGCEVTFSSFGSELKARQNMKLHLFDHFQQAGGNADSFFKQRKLQANRKSVGKKEYGQNNLGYCHSDSIPKHTLNKQISKAQSNVKIKFDSTSSLTKGTSKIENQDFKHFYRKAKCDKPNRYGTPSYVYYAHNEHNYTTQKTSTEGVFLDSLSVSPDNQRSVEVVDTQTDNNALSSLDSFMVREAYYGNVLVRCMGNNNHPQLAKLPPVGEEVSVVTTFVPGISSNEGMPSRLESGVPANSVAASIHTAISGCDSAYLGNADKCSLDRTASIETHVAVQLTEKEMAIKLIAEAKNKGSSHPLHCTICNPHRQFTALTTLVSHYRSHAGIKPFECLVCHRSFTRQHSLNYHLLIHQNATRFTCTHCARKFRHPSHYREHLRKHTGEEPFHCCDCKARFKTRNTFKRHLRSRHSKVLMASGEVLQLEEVDETISSPGDGSESISGRQDSSPAEILGPKLGDVDKENSLDRKMKAKGVACFDMNGRQSMCSPSERLLGFIMEDVYSDDAYTGNTGEEVPNDGNNNATNQSAFFTVEKETSRPSIYELPSPMICKM